MSTEQEEFDRKTAHDLRFKAAALHDAIMKARETGLYVEWDYRAPKGGHQPQWFTPGRTDFRTDDLKISRTMVF